MHIKGKRSVSTLSDNKLKGDNQEHLNKLVQMFDEEQEAQYQQAIKKWQEIEN